MRKVISSLVISFTLVGTFMGGSWIAYKLFDYMLMYINPIFPIGITLALILAVPIYRDT